MSGKWSELAEESDTEEIVMQGTRGRDDARGITDVDVAETPVIIALPDIVIPDTLVLADMPVILGTTGSQVLLSILPRLGDPPKKGCLQSWHRLSRVRPQRQCSRRRLQ